jgi:LysR family transcriptional regulator, glycine cleavage system transcriptional activator
MHTSFSDLPPMDSLTAALAAAHAGSFTAAAVELGVTHAAISRRIGVAEQWAGIRLFERHGRGVRPTPDGQRLLTRLAQSFVEIKDLVDRSRRPGVVSRVRLAVTPSFAQLWLMPRLRALEGDDLRIEVLASPRHADLAAGEADLAIRYGRGGWGLGTEQPLFDEMLVPAALDSHQMSFKEALELPLIHSGDSVLWRTCLKSLGMPWRNKASDRIFADYTLAMTAACEGLGLILWNKSLHPLPGYLISFDEAAVPAPLKYFAVATPRGLSKPAQTLWDRLTNQGA